MMRKMHFILMMAILWSFISVGCSQQKTEQPMETEKKDTVSTAKSDSILSVSEAQEEVVGDTISSFFGHKLVVNDSVFQQIEKIASKDPFLSVKGKVLKTGKVGWGINVHTGSIVLLSSVQPDDPQMLEVVKYLNKIYGKPYEDEEDGFNIKWSSSKDSLDIFAPGCSLVHLRGVHSEEGGNFLSFM